MTKFAIVFIFFGFGNSESAISEKFDTYAQCQSALESTILHFGERGIWNRNNVGVNVEKSVCIEYEFPKE